ncbi:MAG: hypothetical protein ACR2FV_16360 [Ornithinimicrobium sp.]|uniref:hypothetical protein n=1 Tax=Ornithinimicrobium sp. TaxID=1977084 RepID=UPI003D9AC79E
MHGSTRARWWIEVALAALSAGLFVLTLTVPTWIESLGLEPDGGSGTAEWWLVALLLASTLTFSALARLELVRATRNAT